MRSITFHVFDNLITLESLPISNQKSHRFCLSLIDFPIRPSHPSIWFRMEKDCQTSDHFPILIIDALFKYRKHFSLIGRRIDPKLIARAEGNVVWLIFLPKGAFICRKSKLAKISSNWDSGEVMLTETHAASEAVFERGAPFYERKTGHFTASEQK
ncbi:hypothetical protein [Ktedonobacter racemifer]|nr:hypothetical protein [Ktedonobacter racemifer]